MKPFRLRLVPALLAALGGPAAAGEADAAATIARDAQFAAVEDLIGNGLRLVAERQAKAFAAAGHPDPDGWYAKTLRWHYLDEFRDVITGAQAAALQQEAVALQKELEAAKDKLPEASQRILAAASGMQRLVSDIASELNPTMPSPIAGPDGWAAEKKAKVTRAIGQLLQTLGAEFPAKLAAAQAFDKENEQKLMELDPEKEEYAKIAQAAAMKWDDALRSFTLAHIALREVITRGPEWGIDPAPVRSALSGLLTTHLATVLGADFLWGDMYPPLRTKIAVLNGEAFRLGVKGAAAADVEEGFQSVAKIKADTFKEPIRSSFIVLQLETWADAIKWCIDVGDDAAIKRGLDLWKQFQEGYKDDPDAALDGKDPRKAGAAAKVVLIAARLQLAAKDAAAALNLLGAVAGAKDNPYRGNAGAWIPWITQRDPSGRRGGGSYGAPTVPTSPAAALSTARSLIRESLNTADAEQSRRFLMMAVTTLRGGIAGLSTAEPREWNELAPQLFERLAYAFAQLGMPLHAQSVAVEGMRQVSARGGDAKNAKANPWRSKEGKFTEIGLHVQRLVKNGLSFSLRAISDSKLGAAASLNAQVIEVAERLSPEDTGDNLLILLIAQKFSGGDFEGGLRDADAAAQKRPDLGPRLFGVVANGLQRWFDQLNRAKNTAKRDEVGKELLRRADLREKAIADELKKPKPSREALRDKAQIESARAFILIQSGRFKEVMDNLGAVLTEAPPADEDIAAQALSDLSRATVEYHFATFTEAANRDPRTVLAAWPAYERAYAAYVKLKPRLSGQQARVERAGGNLAAVFNQVQYLAGFHRANAKDLAPADLARLAEIEPAAKRAFADLFEPRLGKDSKPNEVWAVAEILWDIGEHGRSVRLYELFRDVLKQSKPLTSFRADPRAWLDQREKLFASRQEFRDDWRKVRDLLEDKRPVKELWDQGQALSTFGEQPVDYGAALAAARAYANAIRAKQTVLGAQFAEYSAALDDLLATTTALAQDIQSKSRLAAAYREAGRKQDAQALFGQLFDYNPFDPDFSAAFVELVLDRVKDPGAGGAVPREQLVKARSIAIDNRERSRVGTETYWISVIQILELSAALGDQESLAAINSRLRWIQVNNSDITQDLISGQAARDGLRDDPRARRPRNPQAVELARRFLGIYQVPGVQHKPTYRVDAIGDEAIFVTAGAPEFEFIEPVDRDGDPVRILWEVGKPPPVASDPPAAPAADGPATAPAAAVPPAAAGAPATAPAAK